ncbi:MAG: cell wall hydrolase/autolysin [Gemmatimonadetes bacterium]|nr:cell wall hydrolase/autolysin [Gemmatimonadota bacterium]
MPLPRLVRAALALPVAAGLACGGSTPAPAAPVPVIAPPRPADPAAAGAPAARNTLPPVPDVDGPLAVKVVYPTPNQQLTSRDSNFIFGSVGSGKASLTINGVPARVYPNGAFMAYMANPPASLPRYDLVAVRGADTARAVQNIRYPAVATRSIIDPTPRKPDALPKTHADTIAALNARIDSLRSAHEPIGLVQLGTPVAADTDGYVIGKPIAGGTYKWFFTPGTVVPLMARTGGSARIRLDTGLDVFVDSADVHDVTAVQRPRVASNARVRGTAYGEDVIIPIGARAPYFVEEHDRAIVVTLYGVRGNTDIINYASSDSLIRTIEWMQVNDERARVTVNLRSAPYGYLVLQENGNFILRLRGRPAIDASRPLAGLTIAVDPGHPPIGSTGPTGLYEPQATLPVGVRLKRILEERGATVVMTRTTDAAVALGDRPIIARKANVNAFVSIHYNAYPDGVNPFLHPGTGTYFFRTHSEPLAREVQRMLVPQLGLEDLGINYDNLAVVRGTWYPAVLCEGAFIMLPDQEAAMRNPEFQERYALGIANGLESYFRALPAR